MWDEIAYPNIKSNGGILSHILLGIWLLIHAGILKLNHALNDSLY